MTCPPYAKRGGGKQKKSQAAIRLARAQSGDASAFDQADLTGARTLAGLFRRELDALTFAQQLEHGASDRAAMEEMLDPTFVADEAEALVDQ
jgi:hypothetical protein